MKKIPKVREFSQALRIRQDDGAVVKRGPNAGSGVDRDEIREAIGIKIPKKWLQYIVTFKISQKGKLLIGCGEYRQRKTPTITRYKKSRNNPPVNEYFACFLPNDWIGHRVTRNMKVLKEAA